MAYSYDRTASDWKPHTDDITRAEGFLMNLGRANGYSAYAKVLKNRPTGKWVCQIFLGGSAVASAVESAPARAIAVAHKELLALLAPLGKVTPSDF